MILQALTAHYETLVKLGKLEAPGWGPVKVSVALYLSDDGEVTQAVLIKTEQVRGKKKALAPQIMQLPAPVKRTVGIEANFLCDNSGYILGLDSKGKPARTLKCFEECKALHKAILSGVDSPAARAILAFFAHWQPEKAREHPALASCMDDLLGGGNIVFRHNGIYPHEDPAIREAWQRHYDDVSDDPSTVCLVTGRPCVPEAVHPSIKGVRGGQSSGNALVAFNAPAYCSFGKEQSLNAPVSKYAAFAYTAALNALIADYQHTSYVGDTLVLFWAKDGGDAYQDCMAFALFGETGAYTQEDLQQMLTHLCRGQCVRFADSLLDPNMDFYILGIAPNAARLSVRLFLHNTFGHILSNVLDHHERLRIARPSFDNRETLSVWQLLNETVNQKSREKKPSDSLVSDMLFAILNNTCYPATLLNSAMLRIRAEHDVTRGRAAIIKAYYLKNPHNDVPEEVLQVSLNPDSRSVPYTLGRLFSVLEAIQAAANPGINTTIKDRYFNAASATPALTFPTLVNLAQKHLRKLNGGLRVHYDQQLAALFDLLDDTYPKQMTLAQQGAFQLGYYHQTQQRYTKKEDTHHA